MTQSRIAFRWLRLLALTLLLTAATAACFKPAAPKPEAEEEAIARTEFTERIENFFEYEPLKAGKPSRFLIHLTDLSDGNPVEKADVTLSARPKGGSVEVVRVTAKVGKVTGIYVADLSVPNPGTYDIEFRVVAGKLDERIPLSDFRVE
jgi:hypothetical protein